MRGSGPPCKVRSVRLLRPSNACSGRSSSTIFSCGACLMAVFSIVHGVAMAALRERYDCFDRGAVVAPAFAALYSPRAALLSLGRC